MRSATGQTTNHVAAKFRVSLEAFRGRNIKDKQSICIIPDYDSGGECGGREGETNLKSKAVSFVREGKEGCGGSGRINQPRSMSAPDAAAAAVSLLATLRS